MAKRFDQYDTSEPVARRFVRVVREHVDLSGLRIVEPSAGSGSILRELPPGTRGIDILPRGSGIEKKDFLTFRAGGDRAVAFIGNPPFSGGLASTFFNRAAPQAQVIAFILPRSFKKASVRNKLDGDFHLLHEEDVEDDAFVFGGKPVHVPAVIQIWVRRAVRRDRVVEPKTHPDFILLKTREGADFAMQRIGARAGRVHRELWRSSEAHYFVHAIRPGVEEIIKGLDFKSVVNNVAGKPSLAKTELVSLYSEWIERFGYPSSDALVE
ncbi:SAM-dependent methyltransferase [Sphingomonas sp. 28-62-11]|uniref:SAM-dependent methyltransferase n=1 Tax=Sphingomonas sp. 28-62-11 TaxID=1970432 RepID=UPI000BCB959C|nr:MAG: hypothetical protein B7Y49_02130 [Sphingomonas sp. 28-62-11]